MIVVANNASTLIIDLFPDQGSSVAAAVSFKFILVLTSISNHRLDSIISYAPR